MFRFITTLALVCVVAALILGATYAVTKPLIAGQKEREEKEALEKVVPGASRFEKRSLDNEDYYEAYKDERLLGYAIFAQGDGYSGKIEMLVGIDKNRQITGLEILSQSETPGLGAKCIELKRKEKTPWFLKQFKGKNASEISIQNIEALTGATITTEAIIDGVKKEVAFFLRKVKDK